MSSHLPVKLHGAHKAVHHHADTMLARQARENEAYQAQIVEQLDAADQARLASDVAQALDAAASPPETTAETG